MRRVSPVGGFCYTGVLPRRNLRDRWLFKNGQETFLDMGYGNVTSRAEVLNLIPA